MEARLLKDDLHGYVNKEIDKFASLDLPQLMFCDSSDRLVLCSLSKIHCLKYFKSYSLAYVLYDPTCVKKLIVRLSNGNTNVI